MKQFKNLIFDLGEIKAGSVHQCKWEFDSLTKDEILSTPRKKGSLMYHAVPKCGCTAKVDVNDDCITAEYTDSGNHIGTISKKITVYYKPQEDIPVFVKNQRGVTVYNPALGSTTLLIHGTVVK